MSTNRFQKDKALYRWPCRFCELRFPVRTALRNHVHNSHPETTLKSALLTREKTHTCQFCSQEFRAKISLHRHLREAHYTNLKKHNMKSMGEKIVKSQKNRQKELCKRVQKKQSFKVGSNPRKEDQSFLVKCSLCLGEASSKIEDGNFENHLSVFYLLYSVLEIPTDILETYFFKYGNPASWIFLCSSCNEMSKEAELTSKKIAELKNELQQLKYNLKMPLSVKVERNEDGLDTEEIGAAAAEIREYVQSIRTQTVGASQEEDGLEDFFIVGEADSEISGNENQEKQVLGSIDVPFSPQLFDDNDLWDGLEEVEEYSGTTLDAEELNVKFSLPESVEPEIEMSESDLAKQYKVKNSWKCPICSKRFKKIIFWKNHISCEHELFLLHLQNEVPTNHVCQVGQCLPVEVAVNDSNLKRSKSNDKQRTRKQAHLKHERNELERHEIQMKTELPSEDKIQNSENVGFEESNNASLPSNDGRRPRRSVTLSKKIDYSAMVGSPVVEVTANENESEWSASDSDNENGENDNELEESEGLDSSNHRSFSRNSSEDLENEKVWQCTICSRLFRKFDTTRDHVRKKHLGEVENSGQKTRAFCKYLGVGNPNYSTTKSQSNENRSRKRWQCDICSQSFQTLNSTREHVSQKHKKDVDNARNKARAFCKYVGNSDKGKPKSKITQDESLISEKLWQCTFCSHRFRLFHTARDHVRKKHATELENSNLKSGQCCKYLGNPENANFGLKTSGNKLYLRSDKPRPWQCTICSRTYILESTTQDHVRRYHITKVEESNLSASEFCRFLGDPNELKNKNSRTKDTLKMWQCIICSKTYVLESSTQDHLRRCHSMEIEESNLGSFYKFLGDPNEIQTKLMPRQLRGDMDWKCTVCDARFSSQTGAVDHCDTDHKNEIEQAKLEGKNFLLYEYVGDTNKTGRKWKCQFCDEQFCSHIALLHHCRKIHNKVESNESTTTLMQNREVVGDFVIHYSSENPLYRLPYKCYSCPNSYFTLGVLTDHIRKVHKRTVYLPQPSKENQTNATDENYEDGGVNRSKDNPPESSTLPETKKLAALITEKRTQISNNTTDAGIKAKSLIHRATKFLRKPADKPDKNLHASADNCKDLGASSSSDNVGENTRIIDSLNVNLKSNLFQHLPSDSAYRYLCKTCDPERPQTFKLFDSLRNHCRLKHNLRVQLNTGPCKEWTLVEDENLKQKLLRKESAVRDSNNIPYSCKICGHNLSDVRRLPTHMKALHGVIVNVRTRIKKHVESEVTEKRDWLSIVEDYRKSRSDGFVSIAKMKKEEGLLNLRQSNLIYLSRRYNVTEFPCGRCDKSFNNFHEWNEHDKTDHFIGFKCDQCGTGLAARQNLENHIRTMHLPVEAAICKGCKIPYKKQDHFIKHIRYDGMESCKAATVPCIEKMCTRRGYCFTSQEFLDVHTKVYHEQVIDRPFKCSKCPKSFNFKIKWLEHENQHLGNETCICEHCGKEFQAKSRLRIHIKSQHGETQIFTCDICQRTFPNSSGLARHKKLHLPDNPYMCSTCGKTFKLQNYLTIHMWSHDPDRHKKYSLYKPRPKNKPPSSSNIGKRSKPRVSIILPREKSDALDYQFLSGRRPKPTRSRRMKISESEADSTSQDISIHDTDDSQESHCVSVPNAPSSSTSQSQSFHDMPNIVDHGNGNLPANNASSFW